MPAFRGVAGKRVYNPFKPGQYVDRTTAFTMGGVNLAEAERLKKEMAKMSYIKKALQAGTFTAPPISGSGAYGVHRFLRMRRGRRILGFGVHPRVRFYAKSRSRSRMARSRARSPSGRRLAYSRSRSPRVFVSPAHTRSGKAY